MSKKCLLIDTYSMIFRAFFVSQKNAAYSTNAQNTTFSGEEESTSTTLYIFTSMLAKMLKNINPTHVAAVFDGGGKNFRHNLSPAYKANRPPTPENLISQIPKIRGILDGLNIPIVEQRCAEADDIIATMVSSANYDIKFIVATPDKDLLQLMNDRVIIFDPMKDRYLNASDVMDKFGVTPDKVRDALALIGDKADNIDGVPGIGPKTAAKLIDEFGGVYNIIERYKEIKSKRQQELISENIANLRLSWELVGLDYNVEVLHTLEHLEWRPSRAKIDAAVAHYGLHGLQNRFQVRSPSSSP